MQHAVRRGWLPDSDPEVAQAQAAMTQAGRRYREVQQRLDALPAQLAQAQGALKIAVQQAYLAREHPDLVAELRDLQAQEPVDGTEPSESYRARAIWRQQVARARAACDAAVQAAGR